MVEHPADPDQLRAVDTMHNDAVAPTTQDVELDLMIRAATNLRARGQAAAADRLERAAFRLWQLRTGQGGLEEPTAR